MNLQELYADIMEMLNSLVFGLLSFFDDDLEELTFLPVFEWPF